MKLNNRPPDKHFRFLAKKHSDMKKHKNIPFFIPHCGCKNNCVFCNQTKITGYVMEDSDIESEKARLVKTVDEALNHSEDADMQIAFFGGSFTGIEPKRMTALLDTAYKYVKSGDVKGIRLSTRPDYINQEIVDLLVSYGVTNIELGMQSTDETVLSASGRGHGRDVCFESAKLITDSGIALGCQMMVGLPSSTLEKELQTAKDIVEMNACEVRIYPTVVFEGTELYNMAVKGEYRPISNEDAVERSSQCLKIFMKHGIRVLRIGLHSSDELKNAPFGANHPSIGEMVYSRLVYKDIVKAIGLSDTKGKIINIYVPKGTESITYGQKSENKKNLLEKYQFKRVRVYGYDQNKISVKIEAEG